MRLLIIDDDSDYRRSLLRVIERKCPHWNCSSAQSTAEAACLLEAADFDVVVSDLEMPSGNGDILLRQLQTSNPVMYRVLCSGNTESGYRLEIEGVCHRFLEKPVRIERVVAALREAEEIGLLEESDAVRDLLLNAKSLPREPKLAFEIDRLLASEDFHQRKLIELLEKDPVITAMLLRASNSVAFGGTGTINSLESAAMKLGSRYVRNLVLGAELYTRFTPHTSTLRCLETMWEHSLEVANLASALAKELAADTATQDCVFTACILHDIGKLVFLEADQKRYLELLKCSDEDELMILETEEYGVDHASLGGLLAKRWGLPYEIVQAISFHHGILFVPKNSKSLPLQCVKAVEYSLTQGESDSNEENQIEALERARKSLDKLLYR